MWERLVVVVLVLLAETVFVSALDTLTFNHVQIPHSMKVTSLRYDFKESSKVEERVDIKELVGILPAKTLMHKVIFATQQQHLTELHDALMAVSTPGSKKYGDYWTFDQIKEFTQKKDSISAIEDFLTFNPAIQRLSTTIAQDYYTIEAPIALWEELFQTTFLTYCMRGSEVDGITWQQDTTCSTGEILHRAKSYSLPSFLSPHIMAAFYVIDFPLRMQDGVSHKYPLIQEIVKKDIARMVEQDTRLQQSLSSLVTDGNLRKQNKKEVQGGQTFPGYVYPALLNQVYNIANNTGSNIVTQAVFATIGQTMSPSDLTKFQTTFDLPIQSISQDVNGHVSDTVCVTDGDTCMEANLDVQYLMAVAQKVPTVFYYWNTTSTGGVDWLAWITTIANLPDPSDIYSISYGGNELGLSPSFMTSFNNQAMKLGLMGTTILASSGDAGISALAGTRPVCSGYYPQFPACSQYITAVGATMGPEQNKPEVACQQSSGTYPTVAIITTGGGFSNLQATPSWQKNAVTGYFKKVNGTSQQPVASPSNSFNTKGRAYPDISLLGHAYVIYNGGKSVSVDGTSASCPAFAGVTSLANYYRKKQGYPTMGFMNPFLYANYTKFANDITSGSNFCYGITQSSNGYITAQCCPTYGFYATTGWDPVTGLGSVDVTKFINTAVSVGAIGATTAPTKAPIISPYPSIRPTSAVPTKTPTFKPTATPTTGAPTFSPTAAANVMFSVDQIIYGMNYSTYSSDPTSYQSALVASIASCMTGVATTDIYNFKAWSSRRMLFTGRILATSQQFSISYNVQTNAQGQTYDSLSSQLEASMTNGVFDAALDQYAVTYDVPALAACTSTVVDTQSMNTDDDNNNNNLSSGAIAGIVIALIAVLGVAVAVSYYCLCRSKASSYDASSELRSTNSSTVSSHSKKLTENPLYTARSPSKSDAENPMVIVNVPTAKPVPPPPPPLPPKKPPKPTPIHENNL